MNERVMQFRIGMFVIVAGLVLTMLIVWFGESPALFRDHVYLRVHYAEAPGVAEGIPVRKSGIRVGEVTSIEFDNRADHPDGVLVTLSLERKFKVRAGSVPRVTRSLIGDASIDLLPGHGEGFLKTSENPLSAPIVEGEISPDPSKALEAATAAFQRVGETLQSIDDAASGLASVSKKASNIDQFISTWTQTGRQLGATSDQISAFIKANESDFPQAVTNLREVAAKLNATLDPETLASLKTGVNRFSTASGRLDESLTQAGPLFRDLGAPLSAQPATDFGQTVRRINRVAADLGLLTEALRDRRGNLNTEGSLQRLLTRSDLYDNFSRMGASGITAVEAFRPIIGSLKTFADKIARDPSALAKGAFK